MARTILYRRSDFDYHWSSIGSDDQKDRKTPVVYAHARYGGVVKIVFSTWRELRKLVSTLQGELNAHQRTISERAGHRCPGPRQPGGSDGEPV